MTDDDSAPSRICLAPDDHRAKWVGKTRFGIQFFATTPFVPAGGGTPGCEYIALYLWKADGQFLEARIDDLGPRKGLDRNEAKDLLLRRVHGLGQFTKCVIKVAPFQVERGGVVFGLVPRAPEDEDEDWTVLALPGDYMAFNPPWDGDYET